MIAQRMIYSAGNYWVAMVSDLIGAAAFCVFGIRHRSGSPVVAGGLIVIGFIAWGLIEYALHRWVLHGRPSIAARSHARHHADHAALISMPAFTVLAGVCGLWMALAAAVGLGTACWLVCGLYFGYNQYALVHHTQHHRGTPYAYLQHLERAHRLHHARPRVNFGVTTRLWDRVFGTFQP